MDKQDESNWREVQIEGLEPVALSPYITNIVTSARYNWFTLLPKNLFEQFQRTANIWFLLISVFQLVALDLNPASSWTTVLPLCILLSITLIKDGINTYGQQENDKKINNSEFTHWSGTMFNKIQCKNILVGHILKVSKGEQIPADLALIYTSTNENSVFVDTSNTTGESNFKLKRTISEIQVFCNSIEVENLMKKLVGTVKFEQPNRDYLTFNGKMHLEKYPKTIEIGLEHMIFRGDVFHGSDWALGLVLYTGMESKIYLNTRPSKKKISQMEKRVNIWVLYILGVLLVIVVYSVVMALYMSTGNELNFFQNFVLFTVMFNNIIPISLFVTMDIVRELQGFMIKIKSKGEIVFNTRDINENMGQIEYILTDKTGTITENQLKLQKCMIDYCIYERGPVLEKPLITNEENLFLETEPPMSHKILDSNNLQKALLHYDENPIRENFIRCMAICNSISVVNGKYLATSSDEIALVEALEEVGIKLLIKNPKSCIVKWVDSEVSYEILAQQAFSHENKVSRTLIKEEHGNGLYFVKGGFDELESVLKLDVDSKNILFETMSNLNKTGLRTMVLACREIKPDELEEFEMKLESARSFPVNSESKVAELFPIIEFDMEPLGLTGIEEIVKEETKNTIGKLKSAGIKIWVLSGDGENNTISTAQRSGIFAEDSNVFRINKIRNEVQCNKILKKAVEHLVYHEDNESISHVIRFLTRKSTIVHKEESFHDYGNSSSEKNSFLNASEEALAAHPMFNKMSSPAAETLKLLSRSFSPENLDFSLSLDKISLRIALSSQENREILVCLLACAESVVFHSLLPHDKAAIIQLVKENLSFSPLTLAVGKGNADIPMMQGADVAVSIQSPNDPSKPYSEVTISAFSVLEKLLLQQGYWNYNRMARTILLFLYKNFMLTVVIFIYSQFCDFSANPLFADSLLVGFNLFNTTIPLIVLGVFDYYSSFDDVEIKRYLNGVVGSDFNYSRLLEFTFLGTLQGLLLTFLPINFFKLSIVNSVGKTENSENIGTVIYICVVLTALLEIWIRTMRKSKLFLVAEMLSLALLVSHIATLNASKSLQLFQAATQILKSQTLILIVCTVPLVTVAVTWGLFETFKRAMAKEKTFNRLEKYSGDLHGLYKATEGLTTNTEKDVYEFHKYSLKFYSEYIENVYKQIYIQENLNLLKLTIVILWVLLVCWTILEILLLETTLAYVIIRVVLCAGFTLIMAISTTSHFIKNYVFYTMLIITISIFAKFGTEIAFSRIGALSTGIIPSITYILFNVNWLKITYLNILSQLLILTSLIYSFSTNSTLTSSNIELIFSLMILDISICFTSAIVGHNLEKNNRLEYKLIKIKELGVEKTQRILSFLLPAFVKKRVKNGSRYIADDQGTVTVIFCDIVDFECICADYSPQELTGFLDSIFQKFDSLCSANGVTKIETVGKTYMACAGLKDSESEIEPEVLAVPHAQRALVLALSMLQEVQKQKLKNRKILQVKIGINSGPVTAGVVGYHKPQFSLVGDTVNTASRMCSTIEVGNKIQLSKTSYDLLSDRKGMYFNSNVIEAKGKGKMHTYIVGEGQRSTVDEAWLDISQLSSINPHISSVHTFDKGESVRKPRRSLLTSFGGDDILDFEQQEGIEKFKLCDLSCKDSEKLKEFHYSTLVNNKDMMGFGLLIACASYSGLLIIAAIQYYFLEIGLELLVIQAATVSLLWTTLLFYPKIYLTRFYKCLFITIISLMVAQAILYITSTNIISDFAALQVMYIVIILAHTSGLLLNKIISISICIVSIWAAIGVAITQNTSYIANAIIVAGFAAINISAVFKREIQLRSYFNLKKLAEKEIEKTENLLTQMMPPHVLVNMKKGRAVTDRFNSVTLLFADIVGFTYWSSDKTPEQIVGMLSELFTRFDKICMGHKVYKVHTIGDCYVVMGLMDVKKRDTGQECLNVINMGLSMINVIEEVNESRASQLNMRIGVHTGEVIGGVIGTNIVRYDIYGADVIIANKMESGGEAGKINVSEITKNILDKKTNGNFNFTFNKIIEAKVVGRSFKSYFISPKNS